MSFLLFSFLPHYLLFFNRLSCAQDDNNIVLPSGYPTEVPGTCGAAGDTTVFDCGANNGGCIPFSKVRDCVNDCTNGADELCGTGLTLCDVNVYGDAYKCGKCVGALVATCLDRRFQFLCSSGTPVFQCTGTLNCVLDDWLIDGSNECGDWSDENRCIHNVTNPGTDPCTVNANCTFKANDTTPTTTCSCPAGLVGNGLVLGTGCSVALTTTTALTTIISTTTPTTTTTTSPSTSSSTTTSTTTTTTSSPTSTTVSTLPLTTTTTTSATTTTTSTTTSFAQTCVGQFQCVRGGCLPDSEVLNGAFDCPTAGDTSDETYCQTVLTTCPAAPSDSQCVYSWSTHQFACGCADNLTLPGLNKVCIARNDLPANCADIVLKNPDALSGVVTLYDTSCHTPSIPPCNFQAFCDQNTSEGGWTIMLRRANGTTNFDLTFDEYAAGFGPMENDDFYMGNTLVNFMTNDLPYQLLVYGMFEQTNKTFLVFYNTFTVASEAEGFLMQVGNVTRIIGTTANDLLQSNNMNFSAKDFGPVTGCAVNKKGGWWWTQSCNPSGGVLTVPLLASPFDVNIQGVFWAQSQLSAVAMMLRPIGYIPPPSKDDPPVGSNGNCWIASRALSASVLVVVVVLHL